LARVLVIDPRESCAELLVKRLREGPLIEACQRAPREVVDGAGEWASTLPRLLLDERIDTVVYAPPPGTPAGATPNLYHAAAVFVACACHAVKHVVLLASAAVYAPHYHNQGLAPESGLRASRRNTIASAWSDLEALAANYLGPPEPVRLTVLRPAATLVAGGGDPLSRWLGGRRVVTLPGHDPSLQFLSPEDLAAAVRAAVEARRGGVYNVAPAGVIPLHQALRLLGRKAVAVPYLLQRLARAALAPLGLAYPTDQVEYLRYSWTVSGAKIERDLGFVPRKSSAEALLDFAGKWPGDLRAPQRAIARRRFDDFGMDEEYIAALGRSLFKFLHRKYWRVEVRGLEHVPRQGRAVLAGVHRGFMPWDAVMTLHLLTEEVGRSPRFLMHPGLIKFPFLANFHTKLGGIVACQENADYVLRRDGLLGIFPEGIGGAFTRYRDAYRLGRFGRDGYVKMALRNRAPVVPFLTLGSAETFPILAKVHWSWWKRYTEWPCLPITPTFPLLPPVPLPSKWHTQFLPPVHLERDYPPEAADDEATVRAIGRRIRAQMEEALTWMVRRRRSIFFGSIFEGQLT
jgi:1-acyl-sn-glycerol-3-phosphate acyltransferase/nucleoside-diphosphate-sugar epimerase